jgi:membrane protein YdbS with pleckstrin-like domain
MLDPVRRTLASILRVDVAPPEAPAGEKPRVFRASEQHLRYLYLAWMAKHGFAWTVGLGSVGAACVAIVMEGDPLWIVAALAVPAGLAFVLAVVLGWLSIRIDWEMRWYVLTDRSLRIREGVFLLREVTLTLANVQEIKIQQGPVQRLLGIADLVVDTAGGGGAAAARGRGGDGSVHGHQGVLRGIEDVAGLRKLIEERARASRGAGLGDGRGPAEGGGAGEGTAEGDREALRDALLQVRDAARELRRAAG